MADPCRLDPMPDGSEPRLEPEPKPGVPAPASWLPVGSVLVGPCPKAAVEKRPIKANVRITVRTFIRNPSYVEKRYKRKRNFFTIVVWRVPSDHG